MTARLGRADLHIHTLASDGTAGAIEIIEYVESQTDLDVIAITDHERIDAARAAQIVAIDRGYRVEVVIGEEITTLGGHLLGLWIDEPIRPFRSLRNTIAAVHDQGGVAIPAHPLVPYPLCAQGFVLRRLLDDDRRYWPDALEAFNPTALGRPGHPRVGRFADEFDLARVGNSDAHAIEAIGAGHTTFPGRTGSDLRAAIEARTTHEHGAFHGTTDQLGIFQAQLRKYGRDARANLGGRIRRDGSHRDLGYPAGLGARSGAGAGDRPGRADGDR